MHRGRHQGSPLGDLLMPKLELTSIGIVVKDLKKARAFYTRKIGLKVRESDPKMGYLALGATKGGKDAALNPWQPTPDWGDMYEPALKKTVAALKARDVKASIDRDNATFGRFSDPDGNVFFLAAPDKVKVHRAGLSSLAFVTVAS